MVGWWSRLVLVWKIACLALSAILFLGVASVSLADTPVKGRDAGGVSSGGSGKTAGAARSSSARQAKDPAAGSQAQARSPSPEPKSKGGGQDHRPHPPKGPAPGDNPSTGAQPARGANGTAPASTSPSRGATTADAQRKDTVASPSAQPDQPRCPATLDGQPALALLVEHWVDGKRQSVKCLPPSSDVAGDVLTQGPDRVRGNEFWRSYITYTVPVGGLAPSTLKPAGPQPTPPPSQSQDAPPPDQPRSEQPGATTNVPSPVVPTTDEVLGPEPPGAAAIHPVSQRPAAPENNANDASPRGEVRPDDNGGVEENRPAMPAASNGSQTEGSKEPSAEDPAQREAAQEPQLTPKAAEGRTAGWSQSVLALGAGIMLASWGTYFLWLRLAKRSPSVGGFWDD